MLTLLNAQISLSACRFGGGRVGDGESVSLGVCNSDVETTVPQDSIEDLLKDIESDDEKGETNSVVEVAEAADVAMVAGVESEDVAKEAEKSVKKSQKKAEEAVKKVVAK